VGHAALVSQPATKESKVEYLVLILLAVFIPTIVANARGHNNRMAICVMNIFTVIGPVAMYAMTSMLFAGLVMIVAVAMWVASLIWACTNNVDSRRPKPEWRGPFAPDPPPGKDPRWANMRST
jgi:hypothetical protein